MVIVIMHIYLIILIDLFI